MLDMYIDPYTVLRLCEMQDYDGNNVFWYLNKFKMYGILDNRILDRIIQIKWNGKQDLTSSFAYFSTGF